MVSFGTEAVRVTSPLPLNTHPIAGTMATASGVDDFGAETVCECCNFPVAAKRRVPDKTASLLVVGQFV